MYWPYVMVISTANNFLMLSAVYNYHYPVFQQELFIYNNLK